MTGRATGWTALVNFVCQAVLVSSVESILQRRLEIFRTTEVAHRRINSEAFATIPSYDRLCKVASWSARSTIRQYAVPLPIALVGRAVSVNGLEFGRMG